MLETRHANSSFYVWTTLWLAAGLIHLTQAIWFTGFAALPAGLDDGRFNHLLLEHGYQSLLGFYDWLSPGQFYPATQTLGMSDTHLGTLPLYVGGQLAAEGAVCIQFVFLGRFSHWGEDAVILPEFCILFFCYAEAVYVVDH